MKDIIKQKHNGGSNYCVENTNYNKSYKSFIKNKKTIFYHNKRISAHKS